MFALFLLGVSMCAVSGYGLLEKHDEENIAKICNNKIKMNDIIKVEKKINERGLKGKLYYYYDKDTTELWAEYNDKLPKEKKDVNIVDINMAFYKMDGEQLTNYQLNGIYNMIHKKYKCKDVSERKASIMDCLSI